MCLLLFLAVTSAFAQPTAQAPAQRTIRVVMDDNYPPFVLRDSEGKLQGILVDEWRLWENHTEIKAELRALVKGSPMRMSYRALQIVALIVALAIFLCRPYKVTR